MGKKEIRQQKLLRFIIEHNRVPTQQELAEEFGVTERTIRSDFKEISDKIPEEALKEIHRKLMLRLNERVGSMKDHNMLKLLEFFLSKKSQKIEADVQQKIVVKAWDPDADNQD